MFLATPVVNFLWFSSPSRLNRKFSDDGTKIAKCHESVNMTIEITFATSSEGLHTTCLVNMVGVELHKPLDKDWNHEKEMEGWGLGEFPHLLPCDSVGDDVLSDG